MFFESFSRAQWFGMQTFRFAFFLAIAGLALPVNAQERGSESDVTFSVSAVTLPLESQPEWQRPHVLEAQLKLNGEKTQLTVLSPVYVAKSDKKLAVITRRDSAKGSSAAEPESFRTQQTFHYAVESGVTRPRVLEKFAAYKIDGTRLRDQDLNDHWGHDATRPVLVFWRDRLDRMPEIPRPLGLLLHSSTVVLVVADEHPGRSVDLDATITNESLSYKLKTARGETGLVSLGALVMVGGETIAVAATGERKLGAGVEVTVDDKWHHGSITKSMNSTVIAKLVERGLLDWDKTLPEMLPDFAETMDDSWKFVTLHQLLTHTSGARPNLLASDAALWPETPELLHATRRSVIRNILGSKTWSAPGVEFNYSNVGYTIAGFIAAEATDQPWETLMREELFEPLQLTSAGFGAPRGDEPLDQPWGHASVFGLSLAKDPSERADNTPLIGPAGTVHMSMSDLAKYGWVHLRGEQRESSFLNRQSFQTLHSPKVGDYGYGWVCTDVDWADGRVVWHNGSNTMWVSVLKLFPEKNAVIVLVTNDGRLRQAQTAFDALTRQIVGELPTP